MKLLNFYIRKSLPILITIITISLTGCSPRPVVQSRHLLGTEVTITINDFDGLLQGRDVLLAIDAAFEEIRRIELMAGHKELSKMNNLSGSSSFMISDELIELIYHAYDVSYETYGAFNPDIGPIVYLWNIGKPEAAIPQNWEIQNALEVVSVTNMKFMYNGSAYLNPKGARIELGAIAKGYAVDRACEILEEAGVTAGMVWAGGDLRVIGNKNDGKPWRIAIRHPRKLNEFIEILNIWSGAVATSGDYERVLVENGRKYHHIFDPETGYPSGSSISSTVVADNCMDADAYATAMFVLGPEGGVNLADELSVAAMVIAEDDGELYIEENEKFTRLKEE
jgi:FAD:protein FMN transferase